MDDIIIHQEKWLNEGKQTAIAIVVNKQGSALRPIGAKMAISEDGAIHGSVSGGCVENAVIEEALECIRSGQPRLLHYGVTDDTAWSMGLMCGGEIDILILPIKPGSETGFDRIIVQKIIELQQKRQPYMLLIMLSGKKMGQTCILENSGGKIDRNAAALVERKLIPQLEQMMRTETSQILETQTGRIYVDVGNPAPRVVIIGAVHIAMPLITMAKVLDFHTILIDPRKAFANPERFPDVDEMLTDWPVEGLAKIGLNNADYVLLISHDDKIDLPAAGAALKANAAYIGMLASRTTRERRFNLLVEEGYEREAVEKIHAPVGLDIGARTPEEIALSILAEITAFHYGRSE
jgi:xanthine dehydrogenase accessory factor